MSEEIRQNPNNPNNPNEGIKFMGKAPPQFYEAIKQIKQDTQLGNQKDPFADLGPMEPPQSQPQPQPKKVSKPNKRSIGSPQLEEIIYRLKENDFIYDEAKLPSKGVFYNGTDGPTDGVLHIRGMTGEEEQILYAPKYSKGGTGINMIFQRCVKETIKAEELLSVDRTYLLIALRSISYGHEYEVEIKCPDCDKKFPYTIMLNECMVNYCPDDFKSPLNDKLPKSNLQFIWHLPRGREESMVTEYREKRVKEYRDAAIDDSVLYRIALMLDTVEGIKDKTELMILLKKLPIQDVSYLRSIAIDPPFGVDTKCQVTCGLCFHDFEVELPLESGFFFPRHKRKKTEKEEEVFGDI